VSDARRPEPSAATLTTLVNYWMKRSKGSCKICSPRGRLGE
jgi:hypothetical protein